MPRDIPVGNGNLLIAFDSDYQIRDLYFPYVGQENHAGWGPCRFGVWADGRLAWTTDQGWTKSLGYLPETLATDVRLAHEGLGVRLACSDAVDFNRNVYIRQIRVENTSATRREVRLFLQQDLSMYGAKVGDTAYYDPRLEAVVHYRGSRYVLAGFCRREGDGRDRHGVDQFATGMCGFRGAEGTWRDAEDGRLSGNPISQGAVDSTIGATVTLEGGASATLYYYLVIAQSFDELRELYEVVKARTPEGMLRRTIRYWRAWVNGPAYNFGNLPEGVQDLYKRSLLVLRSQIDNRGAVIAANDSDVLQFSRDTYSYMWPRDGALVCHALDLAGFPDVTRRFYSQCADLLTDEGYLLHKYNPDGTPASSWHPWMVDGTQRLPIQEDQTALVLWALWRHFWQYRDVEYVRPLYHSLILRAADFMVDFRDPATGLPRPSYDLWEERYGIHTYTCATVYGGLTAARNFAQVFGDYDHAERYDQAATQVRDAMARHLWSEEHGRFVRRLVPTADGRMEIDATVDASLFAVFKFHAFEADDPRVVRTMEAVQRDLWVKTPVGGVARYAGDTYYSATPDRRGVPGNPWFVCTIWLADYYIARGSTVDELKEALPIFEWAVSHALPSGVLAEQVDPYSGRPLSVSPLTWSHGTLVLTLIKYLQKLEDLHRCPTCGRGIFRLDRFGRHQVRSHSWQEAHEVFEIDEQTPDLAAVASFRNNGQCVTVSVNTRDCVGCGVCLARCQPKIFQMCNDKSYINVSRLDTCVLCRECVTYCPIGAIHFEAAPTEPAAASDAATPDAAAGDAET
ncbi:MAG: glycoside hydrolase family 15 protein [Planctomycetes bacterium]|nr:glycoside hydrolase family 15 protein [Planctomycetota bacterium]